MPLINKLRYAYQLFLFKTTRHKKYPEKEVKNVKLEIPHYKYKNAKIIIIHDIDNPGQEENLEEMLKMEKECQVKSILMLLPHTLEYSDKFDSEFGVHETFPYRFKKHIDNFIRRGIKPRTFSQHVAIPATNFYPLTLNALPKSIKYAFIDPVSFGKPRNHVLFYKPRKYRNLLKISVVYEVNKKDIDSILEKANKEAGVVAFNFHPEHLYEGDDMFTRSYENFKHLLKKLR